MGNRILVYGWFGEKNIGDELILDAILYLVRGNNEKPNIHIMGSKPQEVVKIHSNIYSGDNVSTHVDYRPRMLLRALKYGFPRIIYNIICSDTLIITSGGALSDWHRSSTISLFFLMDLFKLMRKKILLLGVGAGPINITQSKRRFYKRLQYATVITTRDITSYNELAKLDLRNVKLSKDLVYYLGQQIVAQYYREEKQNHIGLVIADVCYETPAINKEYKRQLESLIELLVENEYIVSIIPFQYAEDVLFINSLVFDRNKVMILYDRNNLYKTISYLCEQEIVIGIRYHALVLSAILGKRVIPFVHHPKNGDFVMEYSLSKYAEYIGDGKNWSISQINAERIVESVKKIGSDALYMEKLNKELRKKYEQSIEKEFLYKLGRL